MADLGITATSAPPARLHRPPVIALMNPPTGSFTRATVPRYACPTKTHDNLADYLLPATGTLTGIVTENSVPIYRAMVRCYYRPSGELVANALTAADGTWTIIGVDSSDTANYFVIAFDPAGGIQYNAIIYDRLTPV